MAELVRHLVEVDGGVVEVFVGGARASPIVCTTHPLGQRDAEWDWLVDHFRLVRVNARGFGASSPGLLRRHLTLEQLVADLETVRIALGIDRWVFFGASAGAAIGLLYGVTHPHSLNGLAVGSFAPSGKRLMEWYSRRDGTPGIAENSNSRWQRTEAGQWLHAGDPHGNMDLPHWAWCEEVSRFDVVDYLDQISVPTLVWCGRHDHLVSDTECMLIGQRIRGAQVVVLERSGHGVVGDDEELFRSVVLRFLAAWDDG